VSNKHPVDSFRGENRHATVSHYKKAFRVLGLGPTATTHVYSIGRLNSLSGGIYSENEAEVERLHEVRFRRSAIHSNFAIS